MTEKPRYWLMKTEPEMYSIDRLQKEGQGHWDGVRNYQARNNMKLMKMGDLILFYHSSVVPPGVAGVARVCKEAYVDFTQFDTKSDYFDPKATPEKPRWFMVDLEFVEKFPHLVSLDELRSHPPLEGMQVLRKGMRLSIQPVSEIHFEFVRTLGMQVS